MSVWWATPLPMTARSAELLTGAERTRLARLRRPVDQARFATTRVLARVVLSPLLGVAPADVDLVQACPSCGGTDHGRPALPGTGLQVSLTHAGRVVGVAVAATAVGLDVEGVHEPPGVAPSVLTPAELATLAGLEGDTRTAAFTAYWVRKEAALKALGTGLATDPRLVAVDSCVDAATVASSPGGTISLLGLDPAPGHAGAVALLGGGGVRVTEQRADAALALWLG